MPLSCLWVILMAIIRNGWVLQTRTAMELQLLTSQLSPVAISLLSAQPMHGTIGLLITDVPDPVQVAVVAPIRNSDHCSLSEVISMDQAVPNLCVSSEVYWNAVCGAIQELPWRNIWLAVNPVEVLKEHLSLLVGRYLPTITDNESLKAHTVARS